MAAYLDSVADSQKNATDHGNNNKLVDCLHPERLAQDVVVELLAYSSVLSLLLLLWLSLVEPSVQALW